MTAPQVRESEIRAQHIRVAELKTKLLKLADRNEPARDLLSVVDHLVRRSIWIVGGDGWAYDIGYGGLDHVLATGRNLNILVLDTEVYSNTGGQASKATPSRRHRQVRRRGQTRGAQGPGAAGHRLWQRLCGAGRHGRESATNAAGVPRGGGVRRASLILAYCHCIAHGFDLRHGMKQQDLATASGYWPLFRYNPAMREIGERPFRLDSPRPTVPFKDYAYNELRYQALALTRPGEAAALLRQAQADVDEKYRIYEEFANLPGGPAPAQVTTAVAKALEDKSDAAIDLTTRYLGLTLKSPIVAGAGPLTGKLDNIRRLEDLGAGAVVLPSLFEEQIQQEQQLLDRMATTGADSYAEALTYFPAPESYDIGPAVYLETIHRASQSVDIPVVASLNGVTNEGWLQYARQMQDAGAAAIELNIYFVPTSPDMTGRDVEDRYIGILQAVKHAVKIPVAVKLSPYFSAMGHMAARLVEAGADGLVLFNRFYQPDIDLTQLTLLPNLALSTPAEIRLPLLWIGVLSGRLGASLAASTGVESADEVIKYLLAGADVVMTTSALLKHGTGHMKVLLDGLKSWLAARDLTSLDSIRGRMSQRNIADKTAFARANYIRVLQGY